MINLVWQKVGNLCYEAEDPSFGRWFIGNASQARASYTLPAKLSPSEILAQSKALEMHSPEWAKIWYQLAPQSDVMCTDLGTDYLKQAIHHMMNGPDGDLLKEMSRLGFDEGRTHHYTTESITLYDKAIGKGSISIALNSSGTFCIDYEPNKGRRSYTVINTRRSEDTIWPEGCDPRSKVSTMLSDIIERAKITNFRKYA